MSAKGKQNVKGGSSQILQVKCNICQRKVDQKKTVTCSICKKSFEFDCIGYSEKLHSLKDAEKRKLWKCKLCQDKSKQTPNAVLSNVTTRKKKQTEPMNHNDLPGPSGLNDKTVSTPKNTSLLDSHILTLDNISFEEPLSTSDELLQRSVDYTVTNTVTQAVTISEMKDSLCHLQLELASTQNELESYIIENNGLRSLNAKLTIENDTLKKLCLPR